MTAGKVARAGPILSRPLDVHRWSDYPDLTKCLGQLVTEIEGPGVRQRGRTTRSAKKLRDAVRCLVLDLYVAWKASPDYEIGISLSKGSFGGGSRYQALFLSYEAFRTAFRGLQEHGYLSITRGSFYDPVTEKGGTTKVRATKKLVDLLTGAAELTTARISYRLDEHPSETIVLRDEKKEEIDYRDNALTRSMREDLVRINTGLAASWIDLYLTDKELTALNGAMQSDASRKLREIGVIDFSAKRLRRIFNNRDWSQGGRFYGGWWQSIPRHDRRFITINGKHTVEVDFSGMHPALLYAQVGEKLNGDAYEVGLPNVPRDTVKFTFNALLNATGKVKRPTDFDESTYGTSWRAFQERVMQRHAPIRQFFRTGYGLHLQRKDADIANRIMLRFLDMGYTCLPVHDSFIIHRDLGDELTGIMVEEFSKATGATAATKGKPDYLSSHIPDEDMRLVDNRSLDELLGGRGDYAGYDAREADWRTCLPDAR